ncbi:hypothetical protein CCHL11_01637 [Colletotrichum chlorophyti]|uniref:Uncharacterized protein n=1 Tax=Colletotrichum chlorophyti TaxID=708187 RepID=A0A1Q8RYB6_9PEZI|nr:hypothetical protein CCHL11_01637 [Colletotrichum chlorophyti]
MVPSNASTGSAEDNFGGVLLSEHSPPTFVPTHYQSTPSSTARTIRESKSPSDIFAADLSDHASQLNPNDYQLPQPPKFQPNYSFNNAHQGKSNQAGSSFASNAPSFSAGKASVRSEGAAFTTPTGRSGTQAFASSGFRSGPILTTTPHPVNVKTLATANTPSIVDTDIRRVQPSLPPISEEKAKHTLSNRSQTRKVVVEMAAHCQIDGPLAGPLRETRRSELARNHPAWVPARQVQAGIMTTQQAIRRTPGIPSTIANDLCDGLQKYAQEVNNMLRQAINEVSDIKIDLEYNEKVLCSSKLEANIISEEREQLKRDVAEIHRKYEELEDRLARYHVETENQKNSVRELLAKLDCQIEDEKAQKETISELLKNLKESLSRPSSRWMHGECDDDSKKAVIALSTASIAALEQQNQPEQQQLVQIRPHMLETCDAMPPTNNALQPFHYQQNAEQPQHPAAAYVPTQNGPPSSYLGMFNNSRRPADSRTMSSTGWTRNSNIARAQQHGMALSRPYSRSGDVRNNTGGEFKQINSFEGSGGYGGQFGMPSRPGTSMGNRGGFNPNHSAFRPNAPEFRPGEIGNGYGNAEPSSNFNYGQGPGTASRHGFNESSVPFNSPTPRSANRSTFGNFEGSSTGLNRASPLIPRGGTYGSNEHYYGGNSGHGVSQRSHGPNSSGQSYHVANYSQGGFNAAFSSQGGNGPSPRITTVNTFTVGGNFGPDDGGDNERYARAFEGVLRFASDIDPNITTCLSEVAILRYMTKLYAPFSEQQAWSYIRAHMNDPMTRACLISRTILDLLVNRIFTFEAWEGFSVDADRRLRDIRHEMNNLPAGRGGALQVCIDRVAAIVNSCINHERYDAYRAHRIEYFQAELHEMLAPLLVPESAGGPNLEEADGALRQMCEKAWSISAKMFTSRCTFEFRFPDAGARFNTQTMVGVAPNIDPHILQAEHWRVQLVVTPVITVRNDTGASISVASITNAHVICMK